MSLLAMDNYVKLVKDLYNKYRNVDVISTQLNIPKESVIYLLNNYYSVFFINDNKFIAISDTHFGSPKENIKFIEYVYQYAQEYNIHYIVSEGSALLLWQKRS